MINAGDMFERYLKALRNIPLEDMSENNYEIKENQVNASNEAQIQVQRDAANIYQDLLGPDGLTEKVLTYALTLNQHIMTFTQARAAQTLIALMSSTINSILEYNNGHPDFPMSFDLLDLLSINQIHRIMI